MLECNFTPFPVLETERLILRKITMQDAPEIFFLRSNAQVNKYVDRAPAESIEDAEQFIKLITKSLEENTGISWEITLKGDNTLIGNIALWRIMKEHYRAEIGYSLHPAHQGKGIMHEAMQAVIDYAFNTMQLHSIEANINPENFASQKLLERSNFIRQAYFTENYYYNGKFLDSAIYSLLNKR